MDYLYSSIYINACPHNPVAVLKPQDCTPHCFLHSIPTQTSNLDTPSRYVSVGDTLLPLPNDVLVRPSVVTASPGLPPVPGLRNVSISCPSPGDLARENVYPRDVVATTISVLV